MMVLRRTYIYLKSLLAICLSLSLLTISADTLTLGMVTLTDREMENERMKPLVDYVAQQLTGSPTAEGKVTFRKNNEAMIEALISGEVDWVSETVFSALIMEQQAKASVRMIRYNADVGAYTGVIVTKDNSEISSIFDLKGKTIGFEDIGSTSAYFIPYIELVNHGLSPVKHDDESHLHKGEESIVNYMFLNSELYLINALFDGNVDAIALSVFDISRLSKSIKSKVKIIHRSVEYPHTLELFSPTMDKQTQDRIVNILLEMNKVEAGKTLLGTLTGTTDFRLMQSEKKLNEIRDILSSGVIPTR